LWSWSIPRSASNGALQFSARDEGINSRSDAAGFGVERGRSCREHIGHGCEAGFVTVTHHTGAFLRLRDRSSTHGSPRDRGFELPHRGQHFHLNGGALVISLCNRRRARG